MKIEYGDGIKCANCYACENYTLDQEDANAGHCMDCGWLDEIGCRHDMDGNIIDESILPIDCRCDVCEDRKREYRMARLEDKGYEESK